MLTVSHSKTELTHRIFRFKLCSVSMESIKTLAIKLLSKFCPRFMATPSEQLYPIRTYRITILSIVKMKEFSYPKHL